MKQGIQCQSEFVSWLTIAVTISESTKSYRSKKQNYNNISEGFAGINVVRCRQKIDKDGDDCTSGGREFHAMAAATGNDQ